MLPLKSYHTLMFVFFRCFEIAHIVTKIGSMFGGHKLSYNGFYAS